MTNVSSCYSHKNSEGIAYDYKTLVKVYLDKADTDLRESNISIDCQASTPNPQNQASQLTIKNIVCKMQRLRVSFTDELVKVVLGTGGCQCPVHTTRATSLKSKRRTRKKCRVKFLLTSMRNIYEHEYTKSQLTATLR